MGLKMQIGCVVGVASPYRQEAGLAEDAGDSARSVLQMQFDNSLPGLGGQDVGQGVAVQFFKESGQSVAEHMLELAVELQYASRMLAIHDFLQAFETLDGVAQTVVCQRIGKRKTAAFATSGFQPALLAHEVYDLDEVIARDIKTLGNFTDGDGLFAILMRKIHQHSQTKIGEVRQLHDVDSD